SIGGIRCSHRSSSKGDRLPAAAGTKLRPLLIGGPRLLDTNRTSSRPCSKASATPHIQTHHEKDILPGARGKQRYQRCRQSVYDACDNRIPIIYFLGSRL